MWSLLVASDLYIDLSIPRPPPRTSQYHWSLEFRNQNSWKYIWSSEIKNARPHLVFVHFLHISHGWPGCWSTGLARCGIATVSTTMTTTILAPQAIPWGSLPTATKISQGNLFVANHTSSRFACLQTKNNHDKASSSHRFSTNKQSASCP